MEQSLLPYFPVQETEVREQRSDSAMTWTGACVLNPPGGSLLGRDSARVCQTEPPKWGCGGRSGGQGSLPGPLPASSRGSCAFSLGALSGRLAKQPSCVPPRLTADGDLIVLGAAALQSRGERLFWERAGQWHLKHPQVRKALGSPVPARHLRSPQIVRLWPPK